MIGRRAVLTQRARSEACRRVGKTHAVAAVARDLGVGWGTVMRAVADHGRPLVDDPTRLDGVARSGWTRRTSSRPPDGERHQIRVMNAGIDLVRVEPDGTVVLMAVGHVPFACSGVLEINLETGEVILEPHPVDSRGSARC